MSWKVGGAFSAFDDYIHGKNLVIEKDKVLAQSWRTTEFKENDPDSRVMLYLMNKRTETRRMLAPRDFPNCLAERFHPGRIDNSWVPLKACLESSTA